MKEQKTSQKEEMNKEVRVVLFLREIKNEMTGEQVKNLYENKYKLGLFHNSKRVINRFFGEDSKYSKEKSETKQKHLKEELKKVNISYDSLINKRKLVFEKAKRSNRVNYFINLEQIKTI